MNINMLRDTDNDPGFYAAACASDPTATWMGATLRVSLDGGTSYTTLATLPNESTMGHCTSVLGNFYGGNIVDELNSVNVVLSHGSLSAISSSLLLNGQNMCVIGDEILCFREVTLESNGSYTLRGFLRGRRGSEYAMGTHLITDRFVLFTGDLIRISQQLVDLNVARLYKAVSHNMTDDETTAQSFTNLGMGLKPYAPVLLGAGRDAANNLTMNWVRRNRISGEWLNNIDVPMSESSEMYEVEIWNSDYTVLKRTITGLTSPTASYSAADQTTDFGAPQATVYWRVFQMSSLVGRGHHADSHSTAILLPGEELPPEGTIDLVSAPSEFLQMGNDDDAYWLTDNRWGAGSLVEGVDYTQTVGRDHTVGASGEIRFQTAWSWPLDSGGVKGFPSVLSGAKPGYAHADANPGGFPVRLLDETLSTAAPSGPTPGTFLPLQLPIASLNSSFAFGHNETPTGKGHLTYDIWLQSASAQDGAWVSASTTHEIMIPVANWGGYGAHPTDRPGQWYDHDVTLDGRLWHVYVTKQADGHFNYDFGWLDGSYGRVGWKMIAFVPDVFPVPADTLDLAVFINYVATRTDSFGSPWATGTEWLASVEFGVEPIYGTGNLTVSNFRTFT